MKKFLLDVFRPFRDILVYKSFRQLYFGLSRLLYIERYVPQNNLSILNYKYDIPDGPSAYHSFKELFCDEIYLFSTDKSAPVIVDCGSNIGFSIGFFKTKFPSSKITAIEADSKIFEYLQKNVKRNNFSDVVLINKAVWIHNNGVSFHSEGADGGFINQSDVQKVPSLKLRDLLSNFESIDLLKIDIEGAEVDVLSDCDGGLGMVENLFIEYHSIQNQPQRLNELLNVLTRNGFRYDIQDLCKYKHPFFRFTAKRHFDLQLNIFCKKDVSIG